jgi:hypothetical protein
VLIDLAALAHDGLRHFDEKIFDGNVRRWLQRIVAPSNEPVTFDALQALAAAGAVSTVNDIPVTWDGNYDLHHRAP